MIKWNPENEHLSGADVTIHWDPSGIRPVLMCLACIFEQHEDCDGKSERRHWFRRLPCDCAPDHDWNER